MERQRNLDRDEKGQLATQWAGQCICGRNGNLNPLRVSLLLVAAEIETLFTGNSISACDKLYVRLIV